MVDENDKKCKDCDSKEIHKSLRCYKCYKIMHNEYAKISRDRKNGILIEKVKICIDCNSEDIHKKGRCKSCHNKKNCEYNKVARDKHKDTVHVGSCNNCSIVAEIVYKSGKCIDCHRERECEYSKIAREKHKDLEHIRPCNECGIVVDVNFESGKCLECHRSAACVRTKRYRDLHAPEKTPEQIEAKELTDQNKKRCSQCDTIKNIGKFQVYSSACKECKGIKNGNDDDDAYLQELIRRREYDKIRLQTEPEYKLYKTMKTRINGLIKHEYHKDKHTIEYLGCSTSFLHEWMKFNFTKGMTMKNHGELWHVDHVIPCATFNLMLLHEQDRCFHWSNLSPELATYNLHKNDNIDPEQVDRHIGRIFEFCKIKNIELPKHVGKMGKHVINLWAKRMGIN